MKKSILGALLFVLTIALVACSGESGEVTSPDTTVMDEAKNVEVESDVVEAKVSGSFTVCVREVIPDYVLDDVTPSVAIVTEFQDYPFALYVGGEIGSQLKAGENYVFTIEPTTAMFAKEDLDKLTTGSLLGILEPVRITKFRLATEDEIGLDSLRLTVE